MFLVIVPVLSGLAIIVFSDDFWRLGCLVVGSALGFGALIRLALPGRAAGLLQVRSKAFDVVLMALCGAAIIALAIVVPPGR